MQKNAVEQGVIRALNYAFPPNRAGRCGRILELDEYKLLYEDMSRARTFLLSLPRLSTGCITIARAKNLDTFDTQVIDAYFLGINPYESNGKPLTHLMNSLITNASFIYRTKQDEIREYFLQRIRVCSVKPGITLRVEGTAILAEVHNFVFENGQLQPKLEREQLEVLPFAEWVPKVGQPISSHGKYVVDIIDMIQYAKMIKEIKREIECFKSLLLTH